MMFDGSNIAAVVSGRMAGTSPAMTLFPVDRPDV